MQGGGTRSAERLAGTALACACAAALLAPAGAGAAYHLMKVREFFPGTAANPNTAFIELQMYAGGQGFVNKHTVEFYGPDGSQQASFLLNRNVANGDSQRTILIGDTQAAGSPDFTYPQFGDAVQPTAGGGAACFDEPAIDCVSWGNFSSSAPQFAGPPVLPGGIPDSFSITRRITPNCPTLLENADDTNNSSVDFEQTTPTPRNNSVTPTERPCTGGGGDTDPPQTKITKDPPKRTDRSTVKYKFRSDEPGSTFQCKIDRKRYKRCTSPRKVKRLDEGKHKFKVRAIDPAGNVDPTPAKDKFKVVG